MSVAQPVPYYRLRQLIYGKYGEDRFALGCEITARWVAFETHKKCTMEDVQYWCNLLADEIQVNQSTPITVSQLKALQQLFGVGNKLELFTTHSIPQL